MNDELSFLSDLLAHMGAELDPLTPDLPLDQLGVEPLLRLELVHQLEHQFGIRLGHHLDDLVTVGDLLAYLD
jgi:acyl carrier protein